MEYFNLLETVWLIFLVHDKPNHLCYSRSNLIIQPLPAANQACEQRGQITFWENYTRAQCPSLSSGISFSLWQRAGLTSVSQISRHQTHYRYQYNWQIQCVAEVLGATSKTSDSFVVLVCYQLKMLHFPGSRQSWVCLWSSHVFVLPCSFPMTMFIDYVYMRLWPGSGLVAIYTHADMENLSTHKCTSKRVPGIVTFHIAFKSMRDYSLPFRKEWRERKTLIESISFKHLKDHQRQTDGWIDRRWVVGWVVGDV